MHAYSIALKLSHFDWEIERISAALELQPTSAHLRGQRYLQSTSTGTVSKEFAYACWEFRREYQSDLWVQELIDKYILEIIIPKKAVLMELVKLCRIEFFIGINYHIEPNPGFHFSIEMLQTLPEIGAALDIDMYFSASP